MQKGLRNILWGDEVEAHLGACQTTEVELFAEVVIG